MPRRNLKRNNKLAQKDKWAVLIGLVEEQIGRIDLKKAQLTALLAVFRRQRAAGEPTPFEAAAQK